MTTGGASGRATSTVRLVPAGAPRYASASEPPARERRAAARLERGRPLGGPRGVGSLLDLALDVLVDRFGVCVGIGLLCWLPVLLATELTNRTSASPEAVFFVQMILLALRFVPKFLTTAFVAMVVAGHVLERPVPTGEALRRGLLGLPGLACLVVMQSLGFLLLACACVVPVLLGPWLFALVPTVYVLETRARAVGFARGVRNAFERGLRLVLGWASMGRFYAYSLVAFLTVSLPLSTVVGSLETPQLRAKLDELLGLSGGPVVFALTVLSAAFVAIGTAYTAILDTVFYFDQRARREGLDLELALARMETAAGART